MSNLKGVGRIYQQTFIDTYTKVSFAKLYDRKTPITAADLLNDRVLPFFEEHDVKLLRVLTDRGSEFCGNPERHEYELYLAVRLSRSWTRRSIIAGRFCVSHPRSSSASCARPGAAPASWAHSLTVNPRSTSPRPGYATSPARHGRLRDISTSSCSRIR